MYQILRIFLIYDAMIEKQMCLIYLWLYIRLMWPNCDEPQSGPVVPPTEYIYIPSLKFISQSMLKKVWKTRADRRMDIATA